ncbi:MAG TPA: transporter [Lactobacillus sp.]|nr:transporter [Lactobacillus sp.]
MLHIQRERDILVVNTTRKTDEHMLSFLTFNWIMAITPGPNTIMALSEGQNKGFRRGLSFNFGSFIGFWLVGLLVAGLSATVFDNPQLTAVLKVIGSLYLIYLAIHSLMPASAIKTTDGLRHPICSAILLQATNIKIYLYYIAGLTGFATVFPNTQYSLLFKLIIMVTIGILGTLIWTLIGNYLKTFYDHHHRSVNLVVALLLLVSVIDLWR